MQRTAQNQRIHVYRRTASGVIQTHCLRCLFSKFSKLRYYAASDRALTSGVVSTAQARGSAISLVRLMRMASQHLPPVLLSRAAHPCAGSPRYVLVVRPSDTLLSSGSWMHYRYRGKVYC
jgi:hypothetical protein